MLHLALLAAAALPLGKLKALPLPCSASLPAMPPDLPWRLRRHQANPATAATAARIGRSPERGCLDVPGLALNHRKTYVSQLEPPVRAAEGTNLTLSDVLPSRLLHAVHLLYSGVICRCAKRGM